MSSLRKTPFRIGIIFKTATLSWLVTIVTLAIFAAVIIPQQKRTFLENLNSKARSICASLQEVTAGGIVTEDYSAVVDHSTQVLKNDDSIAFVVTVKNDGFGLINESGSLGPVSDPAVPPSDPTWRVETLDQSWRPSGQTIKGVIETVPLFGQRLYHYSKPFVYSGIDWGWIHIGLKLDSYDRSVRSVSYRTAVLTAICMMIGLIASVFYARRIVRPVLRLQRAVQEVASGDLSVRAEVRTGDEVADLAQAFNKMASAVQSRENRLLAQNQAIAELATEKSLHDGDLERAFRVVVETSAKLMKSDRTSVWLLSENEEVLTCCALYDLATRTHSSGAALNVSDYPAYFRAIREVPVLAADDVRNDPRTRELVDPYFVPYGITSMLDVSIRLGGRLIGVICHEQAGGIRRWSLEEQNAAASLADLMALAIEARNRQRAQLELLEAKEAAETANSTKSQFLAKMSHEIRTPINGVVGMLQLICEAGLSEQQQRYADMALASTDLLLMVINDILDISKIEAGKLKLESREFDLRKCVDDVLGLFAQKAAEKGLNLACILSPRVPQRVRGDDRRLGQILMNLLNNAIKFTEQGEVVVRVEAERISGEDARLRFTVQDSGIGIEPEIIGQLFKPFVQADSSVKRRFGGTGLGLAICRQLTELMGGEIGVESQKGVGTTFVFTARVSVPPGPYPEAAGCSNSLKGLRALIVDDHEPTREVLRTRLEAWGCLCTEAVSGPEALSQLRLMARSRVRFEVVLIDEFLPGMDGEQLAGRIAKDSLLKGAKLVLLAPGGRPTGKGRPPFAAIVGKPIRQSDLYDVLVSLSDQRRPPVPEDIRPAEVRTADSENGRILVAEDNPTNLTLITEILAFAGHEIQCVGTGSEAVAKAKSQPFDLVLMDCQMPEMDGYTATRAIRKWEREQGDGRHVTIIALTAHAMAGDREACLEAGMDDYMTKPLDVKLFRATVLNWLKNGGRDRVSGDPSSRDSAQKM